MQDLNIFEGKKYSARTVHNLQMIYVILGRKVRRTNREFQTKKNLFGHLAGIIQQSTVNVILHRCGTVYCLQLDG